MQAKELDIMNFTVNFESTKLEVTKMEVFLHQKVAANNIFKCFP